MAALAWARRVIEGSKESGNVAAHRYLRTSQTSSSNGKAERPAAALDRAPCAHHSPRAHGAPHQLSRPLQRLLERSKGTALAAAAAKSPLDMLVDMSHVTLKNWSGIPKAVEVVR